MISYYLQMQELEGSEEERDVTGVDTEMIDLSPTSEGDKVLHILFRFSFFYGHIQIRVMFISMIYGFNI